MVLRPAVAAGRPLLGRYFHTTCHQATAPFARYNDLGPRCINDLRHKLSSIAVRHGSGGCGLFRDGWEAPRVVQYILSRGASVGARGVFSSAQDSDDEYASLVKAPSTSSKGAAQDARRTQDAWRSPTRSRRSAAPSARTAEPARVDHTLHGDDGSPSEPLNTDQSPTKAGSPIPNHHRSPTTPHRSVDSIAPSAGADSNVQARSRDRRLQAAVGSAAPSKRPRPPWFWVAQRSDPAVERAVKYNDLLTRERLEHALAFLACGRKSLPAQLSAEAHPPEVARSKSGCPRLKSGLRVLSASDFERPHTTQQFLQRCLADVRSGGPTLDDLILYYRHQRLPEGLTFGRRRKVRSRILVWNGDSIRNATGQERVHLKLTSFSANNKTRLLTYALLVRLHEVLEEAQYFKDCSFGFRLPQQDTQSEEPQQYGRREDRRRDGGAAAVFAELKENWGDVQWIIRLDVEQRSGLPTKHVIARLVERHADQATVEFVLKLGAQGLVNIHNLNGTREYMPVHCGIPNMKPVRDGVSLLSPIICNLVFHELDTFVQGPLAARWGGAGREGGPGVRYLRHLDDVLLGYSGPREHAEAILRETAAFLSQELCITVRLPGAEQWEEKGKRGPKKKQVYYEAPGVQQVAHSVVQPFDNHGVAYLGMRIKRVKTEQHETSRNGAPFTIQIEPNEYYLPDRPKKFPHRRPMTQAMLEARRRRRDARRDKRVIQGKHLKKKRYRIQKNAYGKYGEAAKLLRRGYPRWKIAQKMGSPREWADQR